MNTSNIAAASSSTAVQAAPKPNGGKVESIHVSVVGNGYIVSVEREYCFDKDTVHLSAESALKRVVEVLTPTPKAPRKAKKAAA